MTDQLPRLTRFSEIARTQLDWVWPGRIPLGKISVLAGDPGFGKSLLTIAMASTVTNEVKWPDCGEYAPFGSVVLLSAEDDDSDTVKPRLIAAKADEDKIHSLSPVFSIGKKMRHFSLDIDIERLDKALRAVPDCKLLVIDPISAFMGNVDSHNVADVRGVLHQLQTVAQNRQISIVYVTHLNKGSGTPMSRVTGSGAYVAAARSAMLVGRDPTDSSRQILVSLKQNLSVRPPGIAYRIVEGEGEMPVIQWDAGTVDIEPEALLGSGSGLAPRERDEAKEWLRDKLEDGPLESARIERLATESGFSISTLRRAKKEIGIRSKRNGSGWYWELPNQGGQRGPLDI